MTIIGDVHGKINKYYQIICELKNEKSIQLGDFGFKKEHLWHIENVDYNNHKILFGNHDDTNYLDDNHSLGDSYTFNYKNNKIMTVRGAYSIDKRFRTSNIDWWENEQLSYLEFQEIINQYEEYKPEIMLTHDCPNSIRKLFFNITDNTITSQALETMLEIHQPKLWLFGHHHISVDQIVNGTRFICLKELETFTI